jgi:phage gp45-like
MSKKVALYPIGCELKNDKRSLRGSIMKLTSNGILINSSEQPLHVNETFTATFDLPQKDETISVTAVVFKTYDEFKGKHGATVLSNHFM